MQSYGRNLKCTEVIQFWVPVLAVITGQSDLHSLALQPPLDFLAADRSASPLLSPTIAGKEGLGVMNKLKTVASLSLITVCISKVKLWVESPFLLEVAAVA